jgi:hypothetical protein
MADSHFAHPFVDIGIGWQGGYFTRGQLEHADFALLDCYLRFDDVDLLLSLYCLALDLLDELIMRTLVIWISGGLALGGK